MLSGLLLKGTWSYNDTCRHEALIIVAALLGLFATSRIFSFLIDGPPNNFHAHMIWGSEIVGTIFAGVLFYLENSILSDDNKFTLTAKNK